MDVGIAMQIIVKKQLEQTVESAIQTRLTAIIRRFYLSFVKLH